MIPSPAVDMVEYPADKGDVDSFSPPYNRLVTGFVPIEAKDAFISIERKAPARLALVQVSRQFESTDINTAYFDTIVAEAAKGFDTSVATYAKENEETFNQRVRLLGLDNPTIKFDKPISLGVLFSEPNSVAFGTVVRASSGSASLIKAISVIYLHVKDRVLFAYLYVDYKEEETVRELRKTSIDWADAILNANH